jgi:hypothetical protein
VKASTNVGCLLFPHLPHCLEVSQTVPKGKSFILILINKICLISLQVAMYQHMSLKHQFVLSPVSARAYIKRNRSEQPLRSRTQPRIVCELHLEEVPLSLTDVSSSVCSNRIILNSTPHFCVLLSPISCCPVCPLVVIILHVKRCWWIH